MLKARLMVAPFLLLAQLACQRAYVMEVTSAPTGARVWVNGHDVGRTPVQIPVTMGGVHEVRLEAEDCEVFWGQADMPVPWYEEFCGRLFGAGPVHRTFHYELVPHAEDANDPQALLERARQLEEQARH